MAKAKLTQQDKLFNALKEAGLEPERVENLIRIHSDDAGEGYLVIAFFPDGVPTVHISPNTTEG